MLLHFCFHISLVVKKQKSVISVITNITFISSGFKISISKTVCDDMVYCYCCFFSYFSRFIYYWDHIVLVQ